MTYDFDKPVDRHGTNSCKYDTMPTRNTIPLWVADMDFETAPVITEALKRRLEHGCYGYTAVPDGFYTATINWFAERHGWSPQRRWFIYTSGVVPAISAIIKAMTTAGDKVLVQTPVYNCFFSSIRNNGCTVAEAPLIYHRDGDSPLYRYDIDWDAFAQQCADPAVKVFLLCNPHNPAGRVWSVDELQRMGEICQRHHVFVVADEIHCEFTNGVRYTPFASVSSTPCAVCVSPTKAFNIAGLQIANIICSDDDIRARIDRAININEVCDVNTFGVIALQAAYTQAGAEWLTQLCRYIYANYEAAKDFIISNMPGIKVTRLEGTYLLWVDVSALGTDGDALARRLLREGEVYVNAGSHYGQCGRNFIRINLATQRARLLEGLKRMAKVCSTHE